MNTKYRMGLAGFVVLFAGACLCSSAFAQPRVVEKVVVNPPGPGKVVVVEKVRVPDPKVVVVRVATLEDARRRERDALIRDQRAWEAGRDARIIAHRREIAEAWGPLAYRPEVRAELAIHAERMARLNRILDIAATSGDNALATRCRADIQLELNRNAAVMARIGGGIR